MFMPYLKETEAKIVKAITTKRYTLQLIEMDDGGYRVQYEYGSEHFVTKVLQDLRMALCIFEDFLSMLEDN